MRLRREAREVLEAMAADPEQPWTTAHIRYKCNDSEQALDQVIEVLLRTGAATLESTGEKLSDRHVRRPYAEHHYRLTADGPRLIRQTLDNSRTTNAVFRAMFLESDRSAQPAIQAERARWAEILSGERRRRNRLEGREPVQDALRARRAEVGRILGGPRRRRKGTDDSVLFDPYEGSRLGWLYRRLQSRASKRQ